MVNNIVYPETRGAITSLPKLIILTRGYHHTTRCKGEEEELFKVHRGTCQETWQTSENIPKPYLQQHAAYCVIFLYQHVKEHRSFSRKSDAKVTKKKVTPLLYLCQQMVYKNMGEEG